MPDDSVSAALRSVKYAKSAMKAMRWHKRTQYCQIVADLLTSADFASDLVRQSAGRYRVDRARDLNLAVQQVCKFTGVRLVMKQAETEHKAERLLGMEGSNFGETGTQGNSTTSHQALSRYVNT